MRNFTLTTCALVVLLGVANPVRADVSVASIFGDHMVLQCDMRAPVWGTAAPGESVRVRFRDQEERVVADASGRWRVELEPLAPGGPDVLRVIGGSGPERRFGDVLVGEVWLGSGQSNMAIRVRAAAAHDPKLAALAKLDLRSRLRLSTSGASPRWQPADSQAVQQFSALLFAFGAELQAELEVPVGLIVGAEGTSPSGAWIGEDAYRGCEACRSEIERATARWDPRHEQQRHAMRIARWERKSEEARARGHEPPRKPTPPAPPGTPRSEIGSLFERHLRGVVGYGIRGVLWDQGESGTGIAGLGQDTLMGGLIAGWRQAWGQGPFPFIFMQKRNGGGVAFDSSNPVTREADAYAPLPDDVPDGGECHARLAYTRMMESPNAHMVATGDLGSDVHPRNKWGYAERAKRVALAKVYARAVPAYGPRYRSHEIEGPAIRVHFDGVGSGLAFAHGEELTGFAIAGSDGRFGWARARIEGDTVRVWSDRIPRPAAVRYACARRRAWANLFSREGLPALAFRTD